MRPAGRRLDSTGLCDNVVQVNLSTAAELGSVELIFMNAAVTAG